MMKKISLIIILSLLGLPLISSHLFATTRGIRVTAKTGQSLYLYKSYHAMVVGVSNYEKWPKLPNAVNDAKEVASKLKEFGFEVKLVLDPTYREMRTALSDLVYELGREENRALMLYYAGHGETETLADKTTMGYIIPRDCPIMEKDPKGFANHAISMRDIESASMRIQSKHVLMLFDSCFSGSLFALVRAVPHDISEKSALPVRQYITAGREDEQVPDKSMFKRCFLIGLDGDADLTGDGYVTGSELGMYLSDKVVNYTHRRQHPQYGKINNPDLDRGDFIFALKAAAKEKEPVAVAPPQPPKVVEKPQYDLDQYLAKIKEKEEAERRAKDALVRNFNRLLNDLEKYKRIVNSDLDEETKLAAWGVLSKKYPQWSKGVEVGDSDTLLNRALAKDTDGSLRKVIEKQDKQTKEKRLASIPKEVKDAVVPRVRLRDTPKELWPSDFEKMIKKHNFFMKDLNKEGDFPNDFVDNGDGTITDRATGLMWQQGGSSSEISYWAAKKYVSHLNKAKSSGYDDWRIPTVEELCSLLEGEINERGQHINCLFKGKQSVCWSADGHDMAHGIVKNHVVDFNKGGTGKAVASSHKEVGWLFIRAVRTTK